MALSDDAQSAIVSALRNSTLFAGIDEAELGALTRQCTEETLDSGAVLMRQGEDGDFAYILLDGTVDVSVETPLGADRVATQMRGEIVGEIAVLAGLPRSATVTSRSPVRLARLDKAVLQNFVEHHPRLASSIIHALSVRLQGLLQPMAYLLQATTALERQDASPELLDLLAQRAGEVTPFAKAFARLVRVLIERRDERHERAIAARLQTSLVPRAAPTIDGVRIAARMVPARDVGGDFYDWFELADGRLACVVADVSGKGIGAAVFMGIVRTALRAVALSQPDSPACILDRLNRILCRDNEQLMFVSLIIVILDPAAGQLEWANAGHPPGLLLRGTDILPLPASGPVLGIAADAQFADQRAALTFGTRLFLYTDGLSEARDPTGGLLGEAAMASLCAELADKDAEAANQFILDAIRRFTSDAALSDDLACLCMDWRRA